MPLEGSFNMEQVRARSGWRKEETDRLWQEIRKATEEGEPLRGVFERMGGELHRKPNSIRNYYYMQLRTQAEDDLRRAAPFETFSQSEIRELVRQVLSAKGRGESVRACVMRLSNGDKSKMLRLQNKYRSTVQKRPDLVCEIAQELCQEGIPCVNPVQTLPPPSLSAVTVPEDPDVQNLLSAVDALLRRAKQSDPKGDRMRVQRDMCLMQLEDLQKASGELLQTCKEVCGCEGSGLSSETRDRLITCISKVENLCN